MKSQISQEKKEQIARNAVENFINQKKEEIGNFSAYAFFALFILFIMVPFMGNIISETIFSYGYCLNLNSNGGMFIACSQLDTGYWIMFVSGLIYAICIFFIILASYLIISSIIEGINKWIKGNINKAVEKAVEES